MNPTTEEKKAIALLEKKGYKVAKPLPSVTYGMVVHSKSDDTTFVITVFDKDGGDCRWGGTVIGEATGGTDLLWIDDRDWNASTGEYTIIGKVDLSKFIKPAKQ